MMAAIFDHLWQSTLLALGVGLLTLAFRKAGPAVRHGLWFVASAKFLVPFAALEALGGLLAPAGRLPVEASPEAVFIAQAAQPFSQSYATAPATYAAASVAHAAPGFDPSLILLAAWALGCGAVLIAWRVRWARVRSAMRSATPLPWRAPMPVRASSSLLEPGLVGLWRPVMLVPRTLQDCLAQPEIDAIVAHEACHLRRHDNLTATIHMLVEALFWFHPLVWWIGARLIEERERACDEAVVRSGHDRAAYARSLVESCRLYLQSPLPCVAGPSGSNLKTRVEMIMTVPPSTPLSPPMKILLLAAGVCAFASPVAAGLLTSPAGHPAAARVIAMASTSAPSRVDEARSSDPTSAATSAPEKSGAVKAITLARSEASSAPGPTSAATSAWENVAAKAITLAQGEAPPTSDSSAAKPDAPLPPSAQEIGGTRTEPAQQPSPGTQAAVRQQDVGGAPTPGKPLTPVKHGSVPGFATDPMNEANCYILFGELHCGRNGPRGATP